MSTYAKANRTAQWFSNKYSSASYRPNKGCIHTTETFGWPGYADGSKAPGYTAMPDIPNKRIQYRAHFEDEESSRALANPAGGVQTNTNRVVQIELVGTCNPAWKDRWPNTTKVEGRDYLYLPEAPDWYLDDLAAFVADMKRRHNIPLTSGLTWRAYPSSYGATPTRMSGAKWNAFTGWCGHQHVPENNHGDPGNFPMEAVLVRAAAILKPPTPNPIPPLPDWEDDMALSPEALKQIRDLVREELDSKATAETMWTRHPVVYDVREVDQPTPDVPRVTPSTLLEEITRDVRGPAPEPPPR